MKCQHSLDTYDVLPLLEKNFAFAGILFLIMVSTLAVRPQTNSVIVLGGVIAWILWLGGLSVTSDRDSFLYGFTEHIWMYLTMVCLLAFYQVYGMFTHNKRLLLSVMLLSIAITLLYIFPYILWLENRVPAYGTAQTFAVGLVFAGTFASRIHLHNRYFDFDNPQARNRFAFLWRNRDSDIDSTVDPFEPE